jgi:hypothetical protein
LLIGVQKNMELSLQNRIDKAANDYNRTKDDRYKNLWYKLVKEFANGPHNIKRWTIPVDTSVKTDSGWNSVDK